MAERTLLAHKICFHEKNARDPEPIPPADLNGDNLAELFYRWCQANQQSPISDDSAKDWLQIMSFCRFNSNIIIVETRFGKWGEPGPVVNARDGQTRYTLDAEDVPAADTRAILFCPPNGRAALFFSEYCQRGSGARKLLTQFVKHWRQNRTDITIESPSRVIESEALLANGSIMELEVRRFKKSRNAEDKAQCKEATMISIFRPTPAFRPPGLKLFDYAANPQEVYDLVGLAPYECEMEPEMHVTIKVGNNKKKIKIGDPQDGIYYREILNENDEPRIDDGRLVQICTDKAIEYLDRMGLEWKAEWSKPD